MTGRVVLIGAVHEALAAYDALHGSEAAELVAVVTMPESKRGSLAGAVDLAHRATLDGIPVLQCEDVNRADAVQAIVSLRPELIVVVGWTRLIGEELLSAAPRGCVGFHASLLPRHRGRAPVNWSIIMGESETGNTMMRLNAGIDTGEIVDQRRTPICLGDTCATVYQRIAALGAEMLIDNLPALIDGSVETSRQNGTQADVLPTRVPAMGVTDWDRPPVDVHNWIRALTRPYPGAFTQIADKRVHLWASEPPLVPGQQGAPGEILEIDEYQMRVATRGGSLVITDWSVDSSGEEQMLQVGETFISPTSDIAMWALGKGPKPASQSGERIR